MKHRKAISGVIEATIMVTIMLAVMGVVVTYISGTFLGITEDNKKISVYDVLSGGRVIIKNEGLCTIEIPGDIEVYVEGERVEIISEFQSIESMQLGLIAFDSGGNEGTVHVNIVFGSGMGQNAEFYTDFPQNPP